MMINPALPAASVTVRFLSAAEGGRSVPVNSGYRVQVIFRRDGGSEVGHDCVFDFRSSEHAFLRDGDLWLPLGVEDRALLAPFDADRMAGVIVSGARFDVVEGRTRVGAGAVRDDLAVRN